MLLIGVHRINQGTFNQTICQSIQQSSSLVVGQSTTHGSGVYAYYPDRVPRNSQGHALVVFQALPVSAMIEMAEIYIRGGPYAADSRFFVLRAPIGTAVQVAVLGFLNCPGFPMYSGELYYV